jgi:hypothetical protein
LIVTSLVGRCFSSTGTFSSASSTSYPCITLCCSGARQARRLREALLALHDKPNPCDRLKHTCRRLGTGRPD